MKLKVINKWISIMCAATIASSCMMTSVGAGSDNNSKSKSFVIESSNVLKEGEISKRLEKIKNSLTELQDNEWNEFVREIAIFDDLGSLGDHDDSEDKRLKTLVDFVESVKGIKDSEDAPEIAKKLTDKDILTLVEYIIYFAEDKNWDKEEVEKEIKSILDSLKDGTFKLGDIKAKLEELKDKRLKKFSNFKGNKSFISASRHRIGNRNFRRGGKPATRPVIKNARNNNKNKNNNNINKNKLGLEGINGTDSIYSSTNDSDNELKDIVDKEAIRIQSLVRGHLARKKFNQDKQNQRLLNEILLGRVERRIESNKNLLGFYLAKWRNGAKKVEIEQAATTIQKFCRWVSDNKKKLDLAKKAVGNKWGKENVVSMSDRFEFCKEGTDFHYRAVKKINNIRRAVSFDPAKEMVRKDWKNKNKVHPVSEVKFALIEPNQNLQDNNNINKNNKGKLINPFSFNNIKERREAFKNATTIQRFIRERLSRKHFLEDLAKANKKVDLAREMVRNHWIEKNVRGDRNAFWIVENQLDGCKFIEDNNDRKAIEPSLNLAKNVLKNQWSKELMIDVMGPNVKIGPSINNNNNYSYDSKDEENNNIDNNIDINNINMNNNSNINNNRDSRRLTYSIDYMGKRRPTGDMSLKDQLGLHFDHSKNNIDINNYIKSKNNYINKFDGEDNNIDINNNYSYDSKDEENNNINYEGNSNYINDNNNNNINYEENDNNDNNNQFNSNIDINNNININDEDINDYYLNYMKDNNYSFKNSNYINNNKNNYMNNSNSKLIRPRSNLLKEAYYNYSKNNNKNINYGKYSIDINNNYMNNSNSKLIRPRSNLLKEAYYNYSNNSSNIINNKNNNYINKNIDSNIINNYMNNSNININDINEINDYYMNNIENKDKYINSKNYLNYIKNNKNKFKNNNYINKSIDINNNGLRKSFSFGENINNNNKEQYNEIFVETNCPVPTSAVHPQTYDELTNNDEEFIKRAKEEERNNKKIKRLKQKLVRERGTRASAQENIISTKNLVKYDEKKINKKTKENLESWGKAKSESESNIKKYQEDLKIATDRSKQITWEKLKRGKELIKAFKDQEKPRGEKEAEQKRKIRNKKKIAKESLIEEKKKAAKIEKRKESLSSYKNKN